MLTSDADETLTLTVSLWNALTWKATGSLHAPWSGASVKPGAPPKVSFAFVPARSEERRVGKESRAGGVRGRNVTGVQTCALPISAGGQVARDQPQCVHADIRRRRDVDADGQSLERFDLEGNRVAPRSLVWCERQAWCTAKGQLRVRPGKIGRASCREGESRWGRARSKRDWSSDVCSSDLCRGPGSS